MIGRDGDDRAAHHRDAAPRTSSRCSTAATRRCAGRSATSSPGPSSRRRSRSRPWRYRKLVLELDARDGRRGLTAPGFPVEYGGHGDPGRTSPAFETIAYGDLSLLVKFGVQFGLWGGAIQQLGNRTPPRALPAGDGDARAARLLRDDRGRPRLQRPAAPDDGYLRPGHRRVRDRHPERRSLQGVHRQRRLPRPPRGRVRAADRRRGGPRRPRPRGAAARRARERPPGVRIEDSARRWA